MDLEKVRVFYHVAKAGRFLEAARVLGIAQPGLTKHINDLEASLETKLFNRGHSGVTLTEVGEELFKFAESMVVDSRLLENKILDMNREIEGELCIATTSGAVNFWLAREAVNFSFLHPSLNIRLVISDHAIDLGLDEADVVIRGYMKDRPELVQNRLHTVQERLYASKSYLEKHGHPKTVKDLEDHRLIVYSSKEHFQFGPGNALLSLGCEKGRIRKAFMEVSSTIGLLEAIKMGGGIGLFADGIAQKYPELVQVLPEVQGLNVDLYYSYHYKMKHSKRITAFCEYLIGRFASGEAL